jgi:hypothetical protein
MMDQDQQSEFSPPRKRRASSLPLAVLYHLNFFFSVAYAVVIGMLLIEKRANYIYDSELQKHLIAVVFFVWFAIECIRLRSGWIGNLEERVSTLVTSVLLSIFPQILCLVYIGYLQEMVFPADFIFTIVMFILQILSMILSGFVLKRMISIKASDFHISTTQEHIKLTEEKRRRDADIIYWSKRKAQEDETDIMMCRRGTPAAPVGGDY